MFVHILRALCNDVNPEFHNISTVTKLLNEDSTKLVMYGKISYKMFSFQGNILQQILSVYFILELINTVPFVVIVSSLNHKLQISQG